ncbi:Apc13p protein-domain-containing protein [Massariosphaeria phaeospora]|uniref:Apc13p protein-domain-containing protein n=1 Tax=Massariosphaeria phaeospora TaxID=100035 RepID=A0A7C8I8U0_9PLEO|nr:Apc13p protein-domain-containing protein [Massariosphaeria phaeospora]
MHHSHHADLLESFTHPTSSQLAPEEIYIPPHLQPPNPEDEDDVVPDQHAAFGIQRATHNNKEVTWRDLGLEELARRAPGEGMGQVGSGGGGLSGMGPGGGHAGTRGATQSRRDEPVRLALRRRPGATGASSGLTNGGGEIPAAGGRAGIGLPR